MCKKYYMCVLELLICHTGPLNETDIETKMVQVDIGFTWVSVIKIITLDIIRLFLKKRLNEIKLK